MERRSKYQPNYDCSWVSIIKCEGRKFTELKKIRGHFLSLKKIMKKKLTDDHEISSFGVSNILQSLAKNAGTLEEPFSNPCILKHLTFAIYINFKMF